MNEGVKVSVIVPVYNAQEYIAETADYIKNQTLKDIEIIYVDDGSKDDTVSILKKIASEDSRVVILQQENQYAGVARNLGLKNATGEYVVFWDSDDIFHEDALEKMYNKCVEDVADMCICGANHFDEETGKIQETTTYLKPSRIPEKTPFGHQEIDLYLFNFSTNVPWNKMFRRKFILENNLEFQAIPQANDNYFIMKAFYYAKVFTVVREKLIDYRINYGVSLTGNASKTPLCVYEAYKKTYDELKDDENFKNVEQSFRNKALRGFLYFLSKQTSVESYKELYNALKEKVIEEWDFPTEAEYFYSPKDYDRLCRIREMEAEQYLLTEFIKYFKENTDLSNTKRTQKIQLTKSKNTIKKKNDEIANIKEKNQKLKKQNEKLKQQNQKLSTKIEAIKESMSYKVGRMITYIPRKIVNLMRGKKQ